MDDCIVNGLFIELDWKKWLIALLLKLFVNLDAFGSGFSIDNVINIIDFEFIKIDEIDEKALILKLLGKYNFLSFSKLSRSDKDFVMITISKCDYVG